NDRLRVVPGNGGGPVARPQAETCQAAGDRAHPVAQLAARDPLPWARSVARQQHGAVARPPQKVLGVAQAEIREERRLLAAVVGAHRLGTALPQETRPVEE